jgi:hypothetical protein
LASANNTLRGIIEAEELSMRGIADDPTVIDQLCIVWTVETGENMVAGCQIEHKAGAICLMLSPLAMVCEGAEG